MSETTDNTVQEHTDLELQLIHQLHHQQEHIALQNTTIQIVRKAMLHLLPNEGDTVTVQLDQPLAGADESVTSISLVRAGDKIDIRRG
jgi:hypothetical protein